MRQQGRCLDQTCDAIRALGRCRRRGGRRRGRRRFGVAGGLRIFRIRFILIFYRGTRNLPIFVDLASDALFELRNSDSQRTHHRRKSASEEQKHDQPDDHHLGHTRKSDSENCEHNTVGGFGLEVLGWSNSGPSPTSILLVRRGKSNWGAEP